MGSSIKRKSVKNLVVGKKIIILCLQETKLEVINQKIIRHIWGRGKVDYVWIKASGSARGLCICWDPNIFNKLDVVVESRFILLKGVLTDHVFPCIIGNLYAPNDEVERLSLWSSLRSWKISMIDL